MKKKLFILLMIFFPHFMVLAQYSTTVDGPSHLLNPRFERIMVDTIYYIAHVPDPYDATIFQWDGINSITTGYTEIRHSKDGLVDTAWIHAGLSSIDVMHYDKNQRLVCIERNYPHCRIHECHPDVYKTESMYNKEEFEYDTKGRVSKKTISEVASVSGKENIISVETYDYSTLVITEKGYSYDGLEYELDALNRVTYIKNLNIPDIYMELNGKQYRVWDSYYTYFEGGFSEFSYAKTTYGLPDALRRWRKADFFYTDNGTLTNIYTSLDGEKWDVDVKLESRYAYIKSGTQEIDSNEPIEVSTTEVYGVSGAIVVSTKNNAEVSIYSITGGIVKKQPVVSGTTQITVPQKGLYIVTVNGRSFKAFVI